MQLRREEIKKILEIVELFPETDNFDLIQDNSSGIGSVTKLTIYTSINGLYGEFSVEISSVENW
jgi:hypothetical protein